MAFPTIKAPLAAPIVAGVKTTETVQEPTSCGLVQVVFETAKPTPAARGLNATGAPVAERAVDHRDGGQQRRKPHRDRRSLRRRNRFGSPARHRSPRRDRRDTAGVSRSTMTFSVFAVTKLPG